MTKLEAINGLKHVGDDHPCCQPFMLAVIALLERMQEPIDPEIVSTNTSNP